MNFFQTKYIQPQKKLFVFESLTPTHSDYQFTITTLQLASVLEKKLYELKMNSLSESVITMLKMGIPGSGIYPSPQTWSETWIPQTWTLTGWTQISTLTSISWPSTSILRTWSGILISLSWILIALIEIQTERILIDFWNATLNVMIASIP